MNVVQCYKCKDNYEDKGHGVCEPVDCTIACGSKYDTCKHSN